MGSQKTLDIKSPDSFNAGIGTYDGLFAELFQKLRAQIFDMDLIQAIKDNPDVLFEVKGFLSKLNKPGAPDFISTLSYILSLSLSWMLKLSSLKRNL